MSGDRAPTASDFDAWYADMVHSSVKDEIQHRRLGLPPRLLSTSLLTWDGLDEVATRLRGLDFEVDHSQRDSFPGHTRFHAFDGHGNRVEVLADT